MAKLSLPYPRCSKPLELLNETILGKEIYHSFKCGRAFIKDQTKAADVSSLDFTSVDGTKKLREYQKIGVQFIIDSGYCCVLGDQMRLGKTPQAEIAVKNHPKFNDEDFCCLILCRAANMYQWVRETKCWAENNL